MFPTPSKETEVSEYFHLEKGGVLQTYSNWKNTEFFIIISDPVYQDYDPNDSVKTIVDLTVKRFVLEQTDIHRWNVERLIKRVDGIRRYYPFYYPPSKGIHIMDHLTRMVKAADVYRNVLDISKEKLTKVILS